MNHDVGVPRQERGKSYGQFGMMKPAMMNLNRGSKVRCAAASNRKHA